MGERRRLITLVIATGAILAMVASYGAASLGAHTTAAPVATHVATPPLASTVGAPTKGSTVATTLSANVQYAKFGPRLTTDVPRTDAGKLAQQPGCSGTCPMGITDYGLTSTEGAATYSPTFLQSYWDTGTTLGLGVANGGGCLDPDADSGYCFTLQQNAVIHDMFHTGSDGFYWTQNVAEMAYDGSCSSPCVSGTFSVTFIDNIWNFSYSGGICPSDKNTGGGCINPNKIAGNQLGACDGGTGGAPDYYYCVAATVYNITLPFTVTAATNVNYFGCATGDNCVYFYGTVQKGLGSPQGPGYYDEVKFKMDDGATAPTWQVKYVATPVGLPQDFEWVFGGPGGGSGNAIETFGDLQSEWCNSGSACIYQTNWKSIKNAWSSGYDTAEYIYDVYVIPQFNFRDAAELYFAADNPQVYVF